MSKNNLYDSAAIEKLKELAEGIDFAMLATNLKSHPLHAIPMSTKKVDEQGLIWFLSGQDSTHNQNIARDPKVQLFYAQPNSMQFLNVFGEATITKDKSVLKQLYGKSDDAWFKGIDDPNLTAISVRPIEAFYWDPKNNRLVTLAKMAISALTGSEPDMMDQGKLKV
jgi:general stress protein 26